MLQREFGERRCGRGDFPVRDGQKEKAIRYFSSEKFNHFLDWPIVQREDLDGIKIYLGDIGWVMVRTSGTEPMLRVYSETTSPETTRRVLGEVATLVKKL